MIVGTALLNALGDGAPAIDFPFTLIGDGLEGFWRCDVLTTNGSTISQIDDQSENDRHAVQATALLQPNYDVANFTRAAAAFTGGPYLTAPSSLAAAMPADNWSAWTVFQCSNDSLNQSVFSVGASGGVSLDVESTQWSVRAKGFGVAADGASDAVDLHLMLVSRVSGVLHMYLDGVDVSITNSNVGVSAPSGATSLGSLALSVFVFLGWGLEWAAVSRALTSDDRDSLLAYYVDYYL